MTTTSLATVEWSGLLALAFVAIAIVGACWFTSNERTPKGRRMWLLPLLRDYDKERMPSLAKFQLLLWTAIASFAVLWVSFVRLFSGLDALFPQLPTNLLGIVGIGILTTPISGQLSSTKYPDLLKGKKTEEELKDQWRSMLFELRKIGPPPTNPPANSPPPTAWVPSLTRLQMLLWTLTGVIIYALVLFGTMSSTAVTATETLSIPDLDEVFLGLMGLSQVGFIGGKAANM